LLRLTRIMTHVELNKLVAGAEQICRKLGTRGFIRCRGALEGQTGIIIYCFEDSASAGAFQTGRQTVTRQFRVVILDATPNEVREYRP